MCGQTSTEPASRTRSPRLEEGDEAPARLESNQTAVGDARQAEEASDSEASEGEVSTSTSGSSTPRPSGRTRQEDDPSQDVPPLPNEPLPAPGRPPLPSEPAPAQSDDGWEPHWNPNTSGWWFYNRFTGVWQQDNPRIPVGEHAASAAPAVTAATADGGNPTSSDVVSIAGGYNPAIHGSYDENAWYAQSARAAQEAADTAASTGEATQQYATGAFFNKHTGRWQTGDMGPERHSDEAKSKRQMQAFFDVDAAANMHDGRSLKAERSGKKPSKAELKAFKEKRRAKKAEKRRAWLRD